MSEIEWSPWIEHDGSEECPEGIEGLPCCIKQEGCSEGVFGESGNSLGGGWLWHSGITHYQIPMEDYRRITGMPEWRKFPNWVEFSAQYSDGEWLGYEREPGEGCEGYEIGGLFRVFRSGCFGTVLGDWRDTLQERPAKPDIEPDTSLQYEPNDVAFSAHSEEPMTDHDTVKPATSDGSTASYYELPEGATQLQDLISYRNMNAQDGEMFRALYRKGLASHSDQLRDAKKVLFYAQAEVDRLGKYGVE